MSFFFGMFLVGRRLLRRWRRRCRLHSCHRSPVVVYGCDMFRDVVPPRRHEIERGQDARQQQPAVDDKINVKRLLGYNENIFVRKTTTKVRTQATFHRTIVGIPVKMSVFLSGFKQRGGKGTIKQAYKYKHCVNTLKNNPYAIAKQQTDVASRPTVKKQKKVR